MNNDQPPVVRPRRNRLPFVPQGTAPPPMFNLSPGVKSLIIVLVALHLAQHVMPAQLDIAIENTFGYFPYRYWLLLHRMWAGPLFLVVVTPITYMFLHASWMHLGINVLSLAAFGTVVERLNGARFMIWLFLLCGVAGAFTEFAIDPTAHTIVIGASAGISGLFAVAFLSLAQAQSMSRRKRAVVICLLVLVMAISGIAGLPGMAIAWVSHVGGFVAGLIAYACRDQRAGANPLRDLGWFAAIIALPLVVLVVNISRYF